MVCQRKQLISPFASGFTIRIFFLPCTPTPCWRYLSKQNIRKLDIPFCILDGDAGFVLTTLTITGIYFLCCWVCCWYLFSSLMNCWFFNRAVFSLLLYFTEVSRFLSKQKKRKSKSESVSVGTISLGKSTKMEIT